MSATLPPGVKSVALRISFGAGDRRHVRVLKTAPTAILEYIVAGAAEELERRRHAPEDQLQMPLPRLDRLGRRRCRRCPSLLTPGTKDQLCSACIQRTIDRQKARERARDAARTKRGAA